MNELEAIEALMDIAVCQYCGRAAIIEQEVVDTWLISPRRGDNPLGQLIVRCPNHISEWAMRNSTAGRTNRMRERARQGRRMELPERRRFDPLPARFRGAQTKGR
jgi:hypothetical protein